MEQAVMMLPHPQDRAMASVGQVENMPGTGRLRRECAPGWGATPAALSLGVLFVSALYAAGSETHRQQRKAVLLTFLVRWNSYTIQFFFGCTHGLWKFPRGLGIESEAHLWPMSQLPQNQIFNPLHQAGIEPAMTLRRAGSLTHHATAGTPKGCFWRRSL